MHHSHYSKNEDYVESHDFDSKYLDSSEMNIDVFNE